MRLLAGLFSLAFLGGLLGVVALVGLFAWHSKDLPSTEQLASYEPATLSRVYSGAGDIMAEFHRERRLFTPIDEVPELVKHAFISAEDKNFYLHEGVDWVALMKAMVDNVIRASSGRSLRGASGITQQVVKNFLLSGEKRVERKIREAVLAMRLEQAVTKDRILELYLNEIFLGARSYGVTAAAENYFGKRLEELEPNEAAFLAALPKAPSDIHPVRKRERATNRRNYVLREMFENGYIDEPTYEAGRAKPLTTRLELPASERRRKVQRIDYFAEEIRRELIDKYDEDRVYGGGLSIRSTVDLDLQAQVRQALQARLFEFSKTRGYTGPLATLESVAAGDASNWSAELAAVGLPRDVAPWRRAVVLLVGERSAQIGIEGMESEEPVYLPFSDVADWAVERRGFNAKDLPILGPKPTTPAEVFSLGDVIFVEEIELEDGTKRWSLRQIPEVNGAVVAMDPNTGRVVAMQGGFSYQASVFNRATQAQRQPGSSFKPFVYAAALENGYLPNTIVLDAPVALEQVSGEIWKPKNYSGRFYGPKPMRFGIELSQNLMTIRLAQDFGMDKVADYAEQFGVYAEMPQQLSYSLGAGETTLMKMVASYAMFANGGKRIEPTLIDRIQDRHGETTFRHDERLCLDCRQEEWSAQPEPYVPDEGEQVMNPATAYQVVSMMNGVTVRGTASKLSKNLDFPVAGKTGTTNESRDAWFIGFSADLVVGCFIGYDNPRPMGKGGTGGALCAPVFERVMAAAQEGKEPRDFRKPRSIVLQKINRQNGRCVPADWSGPDYILEAFRAGDQPCQSRRTIGGGDDSFFQATQDAAREGDLPPADAADPAPTADEELVFPAGQDAGRPRPPRPTFQGGDLGRGELY